MATDVREEIVGSWEEFVQHAAMRDIGNPIWPTFIYRGQADADWPLYPSLARKAIDARLSAQQTIELERAALKEFQELAHHYLPPSAIPVEGDLGAWWILMQHYGVPTRVLDWTESLFVALYFAVQGRLRRPGVVWVVHPATTIQHFQKMHAGYKPPSTLGDWRPFLEPDAKSLLYVLTRKTMTDRMGAQQMQTTISPQVLADHGQIVADALPDRRHVEQFTRLIIPAERKYEFLRRLRGMNVTARALFPGLDGLGKSAAELIGLGCWYASADKAVDEKK
ncbi:MAG: FRG domain-containing protein [Deltaproteobacteria bacterium]|nr:FRG domain-containing protein [Deltaproteobacteria bacterium]